MPSPMLDDARRTLVADARTATLATQRPDGRPRLVPVCYVLAPDEDGQGRPIVYTPLDEKPKRVTDPRRLGRVADLLVLPQAGLLIERWDEDWSRLAWVRLEGRADILEPQPHERDEHAAAVAGLRAKYPQYETQALGDRPIIRIVVDRVTTWSAADAEAEAG
jgi:PPOX class probable F420-dependent enzyme